MRYLFQQLDYTDILRLFATDDPSKLRDTDQAVVIKSTGKKTVQHSATRRKGDYCS